MALRISGRKLSFEILRNSPSLEEEEEEEHEQHSKSDPTQTTNRNKKRKHRASKKKKNLLDPSNSIPEDPPADSQPLNSNSVSSDPHSKKKQPPFENGRACNGFELNALSYCAVVCEEVRAPEGTAEESSVCTVAAREDRSDFPARVSGGGLEGFNFGELRQRAVNGASSEDLTASTAVVDDGAKDDGGGSGGAKGSVAEKPNEPDRKVVTKLEKEESLDWNRLMAEDPNCEWNVPFSNEIFFKSIWIFVFKN